MTVAVFLLSDMEITHRLTGGSDFSKEKVCKKSRLLIHL